MTIQWVFIATFLYFELCFIGLLLLPIISPKIWRGIFHFHFWKALVKKANMYFNVLIFVLILFFLDSIRDMMKYSSKSDKVEVDAELQINMKLFRSQRNYFISGFAVFLWLVIRKLVVLVLSEAELLVRNEDAAKKAQQATNNLEKLLKSPKKIELPAKSEESSHDIKEVKKLQEELDVKKSEVISAYQVFSNLKEKANQIQQDYDELLKQNRKLQEATTNINT